MSVTLLPTSRPPVAFPNEKPLASQGPAPTGPASGQTSVLVSLIRLAVALLALGALAALAVLSWLPVALLGLVLLLPALLPLLLVLGSLLGDSARERATTTPAAEGALP
jgi:hypothetical protein